MIGKRSKVRQRFQDAQHACLQLNLPSQCHSQVRTKKIPAKNLCFERLNVIVYPVCDDDILLRGEICKRPDHWRSKKVSLLQGWFIDDNGDAARLREATDIGHGIAATVNQSGCPIAKAKIEKFRLAWRGTVSFAWHP